MKKKKIIITSIISAAILLIAAIVILVCISNINSNVYVELYTEDISVQFDGKPHKIEASSNVEGSFFYEYRGVDCNYFSALEPVQPGEYEVNIRFKEFSTKKEVTKKATLYITLPYNISDDGKTLSSYKGNEADVIIPTTYKNILIDSLDENTFEGKTINSLKIPEGLFYLNPKTIENVGLKKLSICEDTKIMDGTLPSGLKLELCGNFRTLYNDTLGEISGIDEIELPKTIEIIENEALAKIKASKLIMYSNTPLFGKSISSTIKSISVINVDENNKDFSSYENSLVESFFEGISTVEKIEIDEKINEIGDRAFYNCLGLKELIVNGDVTINGSVFNDDFILEKLICSTDCYFRNIGKNQIATAEISKKPESVWHSFLSQTTPSKIILTDTIKEIPRQAFANCVNLDEIVLPNGIESIGEYAFEECTSLQKINIPSSVKNIGQYAFRECTSLEKINIPSSVTSIGESAFEKCTSLEEINIPSSVTNIGKCAFSLCESLKSIELPDSINSISNYLFSCCSSLESFIFPKQIQSIGDGAFSMCESLVEIEIPDSVTYIGGNAFSGCASLKSIKISNNVKTISSGCFCRCFSLENIIYPNNVEVFEDWAFSFVFVDELELPSSLKKLDACNFTSYSITSVELPESIISISSASFYYFYLLTSIVIPTNTIIEILKYPLIDSMGNSTDTFDDLNGITLYVSNNLISGYQAKYPELTFATILEH